MVVLFQHIVKVAIVLLAVVAVVAANTYKPPAPKPAYPEYKAEEPAYKPAPPAYKPAYKEEYVIKFKISFLIDIQLGNIWNNIGRTS